MGCTGALCVECLGSPCKFEQEEWLVMCIYSFWAYAGICHPNTLHCLGVLRCTPRHAISRARVFVYIFIGSHRGHCFPALFSTSWHLVTYFIQSVLILYLDTEPATLHGYEQRSDSCYGSKSATQLLYPYPSGCGRGQTGLATPNKWGTVSTGAKEDSKYWHFLHTSWLSQLLWKDPDLNKYCKFC